MQEINRDKLIRELRGNCMCLTYTDNCSKCAEKYPELCKKERKLFKAAADMLEADVAKDMNVPSKWISVKDRLPKPGVVVLVHSKLGCTYFSHRLYNYAEGKPFSIEYSGGWEVTHWMPLPEAPKEG